MTYIRTADDAERNAAVQLRRLGYPDALAGPGGGIDVRATHALAQVKWHAGPADRSDLQKLYGARGNDHHKALFFFSASPYTRDAVEYADTVGITLFVYQPDGHILPANPRAQHALTRPAAPATELHRGAGGQQPAGFWSRLWRWFVPVWKTHWRIICAVFFTVSIPMFLFDTETPVGERIAFTLISVVCAPIFWKLHFDHRTRQRAVAAAQPTDAVAARATEQHQLYLNGDSRGIYGDYTPADIDTP